MSDRRNRLPDRRGNETVNFVCRGIPCTGTVHRRDDGAIAEVFLNAGKSGTHLDIATRDAAIATSLALQFGCPPEVIAGACLRDANGDAEGPIGAIMDLMTEGDAV